MKKDVIEICYELSDEISASKAFLRLKEIEKAIQSDSSLSILEQNFISAQEKLIALEYSLVETEQSEARRALSAAKYELDVHPLMIEYNSNLKQLNKIYDEINTKLFNRFRTHKSCKI